MTHVPTPEELKGRAVTVLHFLDAIERNPDPDEWFQDYIEENASVGDQWLRWAMLSWGEVRSWNAHEREEQRHIMREMLGAEDRFHDDIPF